MSRSPPRCRPRGDYGRATASTPRRRAPRPALRDPRDDAPRRPAARVAEPLERPGLVPGALTAPGRPTSPARRARRATTPAPLDLDVQPRGPAGPRALPRRLGRVRHGSRRPARRPSWPSGIGRRALAVPRGPRRPRPRADRRRRVAGHRAEPPAGPRRTAGRRPSSPSSPRSRSRSLGSSSCSRRCPRSAWTRRRPPRPTVSLVLTLLAYVVVDPAARRRDRAR